MIIAEEKQSIEAYLKKNLKKNDTVFDYVGNLLEDVAVKSAVINLGAVLLENILEDTVGSLIVGQSKNPHGSVQDEEKKQEMNKWMKRQKEEHENFPSVLRRNLDAKGYKNCYPVFYKKIDMDRRLFSKLSSEANPYRPEKKTVFKLMIGLELDIEAAQELLEAGGYTFHNFEQYDLIVKYCIENKIYSITKVDEYLVLFGEKPLFSEE